jgi:hypothetical protein
LALIALFVAEVGGLYVDVQHPPHGADGVRTIADTINAESGAGEPVVVTPPEFQIVAEHYVNTQVNGLPSDIDLKRLYEPHDSASTLADSIARFTDVANAAPRVWLIYRPERDADGAFLSWLRSRSDVALVARQEFADLYVITDK